MRSLLYLLLLLPPLALLLGGQAGAVPIVFDDGGVHDFSGTTDQGVIVRNDTTLNVLDGASLTLPGATCDSGHVVALCVFSADANILGGDVESLFVGGELQVGGGSVGGIIGSGRITITDGSVSNLLLNFGRLEISGGSVGTFFVDSAPFNITGGTVGALSSFFGGTGTISGGTFTGERPCFTEGGGSPYSGVIYTENGSGIDLLGGSFAPGATFCLGFSSVLNVFGTDLVATEILGADIPTLLLTGMLLDGSEISVEILLGSGPTVNLFNVPEPSTGLLVIAGLVGLAARRLNVLPAD